MHNIASDGGHIETVGELLKSGASVNCADFMQARNPLFFGSFSNFKFLNSFDKIIFY